MILKRGYEAILGCSTDPQSGPVLLFGTGGELVEVFRDRALGLPPLNTTLARRLIERPRIFQALRGIRRQKPVDLAALEELIVRFSRLVVEQPWIKEIDSNPLLVSPEGFVALDTPRASTLSGTGGGEPAKIRYPPYPSRYVRSVDTQEGNPCNNPANPP